MITLPSGKTIDGQVGGFVGINEQLEISSGHDSNIYQAYATLPDSYIGVEELWNPFSVEDKLALAEVMIKRWSAYKEKVIAKVACKG